MLSLNGVRVEEIRTGKPVQVRYGPAAVTGDETRQMPLVCHPAGREGAGNRMIRKSEDLPLGLLSLK